jgi:putative aminopeptidase FrvX
MLLERLCNACGIAGREDEVRDLLRAELASHVDQIWTDALGNLIMRKGNGPLRIMLDAHMDEVGFLVGEITAQGFLKLKKVGSLDDRVLPGRVVWVTNKRIPAVIGTKAFHLTDAEERGKVLPFSEMVVDLGCTSKEEVEALGIELGDPVYFAAAAEHWGEGILKAKAIDDRVGCYIAAEILKQPVPEGVTLLVSFSVQEEIGLRGAKVAAYNLQPHVGIALESTVAADVAGVSPNETVTFMGQGPAITLYDAAGIPSLKVQQGLVQVAEQQGIKYQFRRNVGGGNDGGAIALQGGGAPVCAISIPTRYFHTNAALCNLDDVQAAIDLVAAFISSLAKGEISL